MVEAANWQSIGMSEHVAASLMGRTGRIGQVRSIYSRLVNVILSDGELLIIQASDRECTPMSLVVHWPADEIFEAEPGLPVYRQEKPESLRCGSCEISLAGAALFGSFASVKPGQDCAGALQVLEQHFAKSMPRQSVYDFLQKADTDGSGTIAMPHCYGALMQQRIRTLSKMMRDGNLEDSMNAVLKLVGLGPGLTPAGDDFLQGFLFYCRTLPFLSKITGEICTKMKWMGRLDTTEISRAFWRHFLAGRVAEPVRCLAESFNAGDWTCFSRQVERVSRIGHSSGDDYLSGVWWALKMSEGSGCA